MSRRSDVVWDAAHPVPRRIARREAWAAARYHYARALRVIATGRDTAKV